MLKCSTGTVCCSIPFVWLFCWQVLLSLMIGQESNREPKSSTTFDSCEDAIWETSMVVLARPPPFYLDAIWETSMVVVARPPPFCFWNKLPRV